MTVGRTTTALLFTALLATQALACPFAGTRGRTLLQTDADGRLTHNGMTEADVEAGVRAALAAHGLDYDELTAPLAPSAVDGTGPHGATAPAAASPLNGRRLLFDPKALTKAIVVNPNGTESAIAAIAAGKNFTLPDAIGSQLQTRFLNFNVSADQDDVVAKAVQVYSSIITPANMALFVRAAFHEAGTYNPNAPAGEQGGSNGSIRFELNWVSNGGIQRFAFPWLWAGKQIMEKHYPGVLTWADVIPLAAAAAVKNAGGPYVNVGYGRPEAQGPDPFNGVGARTEVTKDWSLDKLLPQWEYFGQTAETLCILSGAHTFGISATSSPQGLMARPFFTNVYYKNVLSGLGFFESDKTLATPGGATLDCVQKCAISEKYFFQEWRQHFYDMTWWGVPDTVVRKGLTKY